jgi:hypothetical protein
MVKCWSVHFDISLHVSTSVATLLEPPSPFPLDPSLNTLLFFWVLGTDSRVSLSLGQNLSYISSPSLMLYLSWDLAEVLGQFLNFESSYLHFRVASILGPCSRTHTLSISLSLPQPPYSFLAFQSCFFFFKWEYETVFVCLFVCCFVLFWDRVLLCGPGFPKTPHMDQAGLKLTRELLAPASLTSLLKSSLFCVPWWSLVPSTSPQMTQFCCPLWPNKLRSSMWYVFYMSSSAEVHLHWFCHSLSDGEQYHDKHRCTGIAFTWPSLFLHYTSRTDITCGFFF